MNIQSTSNQNTVQTAQTYTASQTASTKFSKLLASSSSENTNFLVQNFDPTQRQNKPSTKEFMDATGASFDEAKVLYVDDGRDTRDWTKIMSSANPLQSAREATEQMYNDPNRIKTVGTIPSSSEVYAKTQNFVYYNAGDGVDRLALTDKNGVILRQLHGSSEHIKNDILNFGFDTAQLQELNSLLNANKINSPMTADTKTNTFLDLEGLSNYINGENPSNAYYISAVDQLNTKPTITYSQTIYPTTNKIEPKISTNENTILNNTAENEQIVALYKNYFDREPDPDGLTYWTQKISEGVSFQDIEKSFYNSSEFMMKMNSTNHINQPTLSTINQKNYTTATLEELLKLL